MEKEIIWIAEEFDGETIEVAYRKGVPGKTKEEMEAFIAAVSEEVTNAKNS